MDEDVFEGPPEDREDLDKSKTNLESAVEGLDDEQKVNVVIQGFMVGKGSEEAHKLHTYWLTLRFGLEPKDGGIFQRACLESLDDVGKKEIVQAAHRAHPKDMKERVVKRMVKWRDEFDEEVDPTETALIAIRSRIPDISQSYVDRLSDDVKSEIQGLAFDDSVDLDPKSVQVTTLSRIAEELGAYDDVGPPGE